MSAFRLLSGLFLLSAVALVTGCGIGTPAASTPEVMHLALTGSVHGGQQPVAGAHVAVLQAAISGYGAASNDLISIGGSSTAGVTTGTPDYVTTNSFGGFSITGDYKCAGTGPVYLLATQGNPGLGTGINNSALAELAVIAPSCGSGATLSSSLQIGISEVSTVAGVYALSGYMTAPLAVSAPNNTLALSGITNAANTAMSLTNLATGSALPTTAAGGTVPVATINLLADIIASCINSAGPGSAGCATLFGAATSTGTKSGTAPTDTVTALLNIAHHPGLNVATLYKLSTATAPYQPTPATQPNDLTLAVTFPNQYQFLAPVAVNPNLPTIDASGNVIVPGIENNSLSSTKVSGATIVYNNLGAVLSINDQLSNAFNGTTEFAVNKWAIDQQGNGWGGPTTAQGSNLQFARLMPATGLIKTYTPGSTTANFSVDAAIDISGLIYLPTIGNNTSLGSQVYDSSGNFAGNFFAGFGIAIDSATKSYVTTPIGTYYVVKSGYGNLSGGGLGPASLLAVDATNNIWAVNNNNSLSEFDSKANALSPASGYTGGGLSFNTTAQPTVQIVMDGASNAWVPNYAGNSISQFSNTGVAISPAASGTFTGGFQTGCNSKGLAVDGSGNVWVTCDNPGYTAGQVGLVEFLGLATPVATPVLPNQLGARP